ncbi:MAG: CAP domain-containing protein [Defluviitaleaceae bacterium]|nr:CAP domain-containing protein [Defluviitaleaceae bacterium]
MLRNRLKNLIGMGLAAVITVGSFSGVSVDVHASTVGYEPTITIHPHGVKNRAEFIARFTDIGMMFFSCSEGRDRVYNLDCFFDEYPGRVFTDTNITMEFRYHGSDVVTARAQKVMLVTEATSQPRKVVIIQQPVITRPQVDVNILPSQPSVTRETPFLYTQSSMSLPNRRLTENERQAWIKEYHANGGASAFELEVIKLVNEIRRNHSLNELSICETLMMASRFYVQTLANLDLPLGHGEGPYGGSGNTVRAFGFNDGTGGNGHWGQWASQTLVDGWMNSPGHRDNILNSGYTHVGLGSHLGGQWGVFHYMSFR